MGGKGGRWGGRGGREHLNPPNEKSSSTSWKKRGEGEQKRKGSKVRTAGKGGGSEGGGFVAGVPVLSWCKGVMARVSGRDLITAGSLKKESRGGERDSEYQERFVALICKPKYEGRAKKKN